MRRLAFTILLTLAAAGCGAGSNHEPAASVSAGARVFASSCTGCHTLAAGRGPARAGGPLAGYRMTNAQIESFVRQMPVPRRLSDFEVRSVAAFVARAQRAHAAK